jgi:hypothetical protein
MRSQVAATAAEHDGIFEVGSQLVMACTSGIVGDFDGALQGSLAALEQLGGQDEPFWTAMADYTAGLMEMTDGRYDDALRHLTMMRDLAERCDHPWLGDRAVRAVPDGHSPRSAAGNGRKAKALTP